MNCLIGALIYKFRYGGKLKYLYPTGWSGAFWGHWFIWKDPYCIWYSSRLPGELASRDLNPLQQLWFKGGYRYKKEN